jgi:ferredoxin
MTTVLVDRTRCIGSGVCETIAETVFAVGDDNVACVVADEPIRGDAARAAALACPTGAITVTD